MKTILALLLLVLVLVGGYLIFSRQTKNDRQGSEEAGSSQSVQSSVPSSRMTFFITSRNPGRGADLGGVEGADKFCQMLADEAGAGNRNWRAYLSASGINARDRIGNGPWHNFRGDLIADNINELHQNNSINKETALTEKGEKVNGRGDDPNRHDILTGSSPDGRAIEGSDDTTCRNWTSSNEGVAMVGHHDRVGLRDDEPSRSWNSSHLSRGCSNEALASSGGSGLLYCFAQ